MLMRRVNRGKRTSTRSATSTTRDLVKYPPPLPWNLNQLVTRNRLPQAPRTRPRRPDSLNRLTIRICRTALIDSSQDFYPTSFYLLDQSK